MGRPDLSCIRCNLASNRSLHPRARLRMTYRELNRRTRWVLATIWASGLACLALSAVRTHAGGNWWQFALPLAVFIILTTVAELFPVSFELCRSEITVSTVFLLGPFLCIAQVPHLGALPALSPRL